MATPILGVEGARIFCGPDWAAVSCRATDANGVAVGIEVFDSLLLDNRVAHSADADPKSAEGAPTASNLYTATGYVGGLSANTKYWWRVYMHDGIGNYTYGTGDLYSGTFITDPDGSSTAQFKIGITSCICGEQLGQNDNWANRSSQYFKNTLKLGLRKLFFIGDIVYPDEATKTPGVVRGTDPDVTPFVDNSWYVQNKNTVADGSKARFATNIKTTLDANLHMGKKIAFAHVLAAIPTDEMWDDHDYGINDSVRRDLETDATRQAKLDIAYELMGAWFMDGNKYYIENDTQNGIARTAPDHTDVGAFQAGPQDHYHKVDMPTGPNSGIRFMVLDCRSERHLAGDTDTTSKVMIGNGGTIPADADSQEGWFSSRVADLPDNWFLIICSPVAGDGNHGWKTPPGSAADQGWKAYSYQFQRLLQIVRDAGLAAKTVIVSGDTHSGAVGTFDDPTGATPPIWEFMNGNYWNNGGMKQTNGWSMNAGDDLRIPGEQRAAIGYGGKPQRLSQYNTNMTVIEAGDGWMRVSGVDLYRESAWSGPMGSRETFSRFYSA